MNNLTCSNSEKQAMRSEIKSIMKCYIDVMCKTIAFLEIKSSDQVEVVLKDSKNSLVKLLSIDAFLKKHKYDIGVAICGMQPRKSAVARQSLENLLEDMDGFLYEFENTIRVISDVTKKIRKHK